MLGCQTIIQSSRLLQCAVLNLTSTSRYRERRKQQSICYAMYHIYYTNACVLYANATYADYYCIHVLITLKQLHYVFSDSVRAQNVRACAAQHT